MYNKEITSEDIGKLLKLYTRSVEWIDAEKCDDRLQEMIRSADLDTLRKILTCYVRGERFQDGMLGSMIVEGILHSILSRLQVISDEIKLKGDDVSNTTQE